MCTQTLVTTLVTCSLILSGIADTSAGQDQASASSPEIEPVTAPRKSNWAVAYENDVFVPGSRDQDYTFGLNITFTGDSADDHWASLHNGVDWINHKFGFDQFISPGIETSKIEYGLFGFTPEDISRVEANSNDRPYSSLVYVSSTRENYDRARQVSWQSTLTLGILGLKLAGELQQDLHRIIDSQQPLGWDNQISQGGEATFRYSLSRQHLLSRIGSNVEVKSTLQASLGYITEASWSLSLRAGKLNTPWISFNPELASYGEKSNPNDFVRVSEQYVWAGVSLKLRAYNALLHGQLRDSDVTFDSADINHGIVEAWLGYTMALSNGYSFTYSIRGHTSELKHGAGDRDVLWGGVLISKTIY